MYCIVCLCGASHDVVCAAIPMGLATSLGLAVIALDLPLTPIEAGDGAHALYCT